MADLKILRIIQDRKGNHIMKQLLAILVMLNTPFLSIHLDAQRVRTHPAPGLGDYDLPFYSDGTYEPDVLSPDEFLGFALGSRPVTHREVTSYFEYLAEALPNATLNTYGHTYEGRKLIYLTITSERNGPDLEIIQKNITLLADPRKLKNEQIARKIIETSPAIAWMGYAIHGDELSSTDAALQLAYQLLAGNDEVSEKIRNNLVVCIDPLQNPDGRTRFLTQFTQFSSALPNTDVQSLQHRGVWPWGRGNHYLFDLNRDWFALVHPETRGKVKAMLSWHPQFVVDCHEMGAFDTYLFDPPREPFNPFLPHNIRRWWDIFAKDQAAAFDHYGWSYYTREWNEEMYPGYGSSWPIYTGAVGILYEQAGVDGSQVKRPDGTILTYREAVHHQFISSLANLETAADHREELLEDYYSQKVEASGAGRTKTRNAAFLFPPGTHPTRQERFAEVLTLQGIEVEMSKESFKVRGALSANGTEARELTLPQRTLIVWLNQPNRNLVEAILTFDVRFNTDFLETQRKSRLKHGRSEIYDVTGWSLAVAYDSEAYFSEAVPDVGTVLFLPSGEKGGIEGKSPKVGYLFSGDDERALMALVPLMEKGVKVWCARKPFEVEGREFPKGSFLIRISANREVDEEALETIAKDAGIVMYGINEGLVTGGPDLGGREFQLLTHPRIALVGGSPVSTYEFGAVWHLLDSRMAIPVSTLDISTLSRTDLDKYNVLLLPSVWGGPGTYKRLLGDVGIGNLKDWIKDGGTLVAMGSATAFLADTSSGLSSVRQKRQVLKKLPEYEEGLRASKEAESPQVDSLAVWEGKMPEEKEKASPTVPDRSEVERRDELARKLSPQGVIMKVELDEEHWLGFGCGNEVPVTVNTSFAYLAKGSVEVAGRLADRDLVRLSGLLWPEARERWSETVWASREGMGKGQMILFATQPNFRAYFHGSERMLLNALLLGPGFGSRPTVEWR
ncbi:MAG: M14 metallopeptidase family protein [Candidatus Neomarinimicrobiota bacterium]